MPWCPVCRVEYEAGRTACENCGAALVEAAPGEVEGAEPVVILHAQTANEARVVEATLEAEGIEAFVQPPATVLPQYGTIVDESPELDVLVAAEDVGEAAAVLNSGAVSDEELAAEAEGGASAPNDEPGAVV